MVGKNNKNQGVLVYETISTLIHCMLFLIILEVRIQSMWENRRG